VTLSSIIFLNSFISNILKIFCEHLKYPEYSDILFQDDAHASFIMNCNVAYIISSKCFVIEIYKIRLIFSDFWLTFYDIIIIINWKIVSNINLTVFRMTSRNRRFRIVLLKMIISVFCNAQKLFSRLYNIKQIRGMCYDKHVFQQNVVAIILHWMFS